MLAPRVLFLGNSYVFFNDLPALVAAFGQAAGLDVQTEAVTTGGMTLLGHLQNPQALARVRARPDVVILQEQSLRPIQSPQAMALAARALVAETRQAGARPLFYLTWARQQTPERQAALDAAYRGLGAELDVPVAPAGPAWQRALAARGDVGLYRPDGSHPQPAGTYLAACCLHGLLTGQSPVGLPVRAMLDTQGGPGRPVELGSELTAFLQRIAAEALAAEAAVPAVPGTWPEVDPEAALLQDLAALQGLTAAQIAALQAAGARRQVPAGTTLLSPASAEACIVLAGEVEVRPERAAVTRHNADRMGQALAFGMGGLFGEAATVTVVATAPSTVLTIDPARGRALVAGDRDLAAVLWRNVGRR